MPALVLIVVAFNAPLAAIAGFVQLSVGFGNGIGAPVSFVAAGAILLIFSVGFVGMSRYMSDPGAFYRYISAGIGRRAGVAGAFLATAAYILLCAGSYPYMGLVTVDLFTHLTGGSALPWQAWSVMFLCAITAIGLFRIDLSMKFLGKLVALEVVLVAIWQGAVLIQGGPEGYSFESFTPRAFAHGSVGLGILFAMLTMIGIESGVCLTAETRNPERDVARATYISIAFLALFYGMGTWCYIVTQGASRAVDSALSNPVGSFTASVQLYLGRMFANLTSITLVTSQMVSICAVQTAASRYLFALGRDRLLPRALGRVHRRLQSPHVAVTVNGVISLTILACIFAGRIDPVTSYAALTGMGIYFILPLFIATSIAIVVFYRRNPALRASRTTRVLAPAVAAASLSALFVLTSLNLSVLVGTMKMAYLSMAAVIAVPVVGWLRAALHERGRASGKLPEHAHRGSG